MHFLDVLRTIVIAVIPVLFAITVHEVAHGWVAKQLGDSTADRLGRLTLNPIKHIDLWGTVLVPLFLVLISAPFLFGWAKPVPVDYRNLRNPKRDMAIVAAAGPGANLLMAIIWVLIGKIGVISPVFSEAIVAMAVIGIFINLLLMVFNLLPLPPLDGGRVAVGLLPGPWARQLSRVEPYGFIILLGLLFTGLLWTILPSPVKLHQFAIYLINF